METNFGHNFKTNLVFKCSEKYFDLREDWNDAKYLLEYLTLQKTKIEKIGFRLDQAEISGFTLKDWLDDLNYICNSNS